MFYGDAVVRGMVARVYAPTRTECEAVLFTDFPEVDQVFTCPAVRDADGEWSPAGSDWMARDRAMWEAVLRFWVH